MSRKSSGRRPTAYERALWERVVEKATPLARRHSVAEPSAPEPEIASPGAVPKTPGIDLPPDFAIGRSAQVPPPLPAGPAAPRMDQKRHARMTRGKLAPEGRIDLHGMTLADAQPALTQFILRAHASGKRLVLVITGKGRARDDGGPIPARTGILRQQVPGWLTSGPLAGLVLDIATAHQKHGGSGAYYVYLRRKR